MPHRLLSLTDLFPDALLSVVTGSIVFIDIIDPTQWIPSTASWFLISSLVLLNLAKAYQIYMNVRRGKKDEK